MEKEKRTGHLRNEEIEETWKDSMGTEIRNCREM
jgi:hypothetical protein